MFPFGRNVKLAVPRKLEDKALVLGRDDLRFFDGRSNPAFTRDIVSLIEKDYSAAQTSGKDYDSCSYSMLAISGGSSDGAYGAGIIKGWTESGTRPVFKAVTGISTGALIAPLAFLGKEYDDVLERFYTRTSAKDILRYKGPLRVILGNSLTSNHPLEKIIRTIVTKDLLRKIAEERSKGRGLYVGTTNFDAQRLVVWNMGKIAAVGNDEAMDLFCRVILASTAIPAVFPPVFIDVQAEGKRYKEMHLDGGALTQVFFLYGALKDLKEMAADRNIDMSQIRIKLYLILNGYLLPRWKAVKDDLISIYGRYNDTQCLAQNWGDLYRLYHFSKEFGHEFNAAYIPRSFKPETEEEFNSGNMNRLFELGYDQAKAGYPWTRAIDSIVL